jgi:hypothetical protein
VPPNTSARNVNVPGGGSKPETTAITANLAGDYEKLADRTGSIKYVKAT